MIHNTIVSLVASLLLITMIGCGSSDSAGTDATDTNTSGDTSTTDTSTSNDSSSYIVTDLQNGMFKIDFTINSTTSIISYSFTKEDVTSDNYEDVLRAAATGNYIYATSETSTLTCTKETTTSFKCTDSVDPDEVTLTPGDGIYLFKTTATSVTDFTFENQLTMITMLSASGEVGDDVNSTDDSTDTNTTQNVDNTTNTVEVAYIVKKTGQTQSFDDNGVEITDGSLKDDGYHQTGVEARYTRASDIVTDELTGLMWQDDTWELTTEDEDAGIYTEKRTWAQAVDKCENLTLGGYTNWKLPSKKELQNIIDYSVNDYSIAVEFENRPPSYIPYWTSSEYVADTTLVWTVVFYLGSTSTYDKVDLNNVRCARNQE